MESGLRQTEAGRSGERRDGRQEAILEAMDLEPGQRAWWRSGVSRQPHKNVSLGEVLTSQ